MIENIPILFYCFFFFACLGFGVGVVLARRPVYSLINLIGVMVSLAAIFLLSGSELLAVLQILVYAGAVIVLFLFVIMLLNLRQPERASAPHVARPWIAGLLGIVFILVAASGVVSVVSPTEGGGGLHRFANATEAPADTAPAATPIDQGESVRAVARLVLTDYLLAFELISILLLVAMVAVVAATNAAEGGAPPREPDDAPTPEKGDAS